MVSVSLVSLLSVITIFRLTQCNFGFTCVFYSLIVSHAPLPSIGVAGTQESPFTERVLCPYTHTQMHKTHPHWNKHNPPAPLSWVTLLKQNNNDRVQGGDLCVCVLSWRTHRHANSIESPPCWSLIVWVQDGGQNWTRGGAVSTEKNSSEVLLDSVKSCDNAFPM